MSRESAGASPAGEGPVATALTWLQQVGEVPVVNPTKHKWTVPDRKPRRLSWLGWFLYAVTILLVLVGYSIWFGGASSAFIYAGF